MSKISLIIEREYITRVKKKTFIIMTILGPILIAALWIVPIYVTTLSQGKKTVEILDETGLFFDQFQSDEHFRFVPIFTDLETAKKGLIASGDDALVYIPRTELNVPVTAILYSTSQTGIDIKTVVKENLRKQVEALKLKAKNIDPEVLTSIKTSIIINSIKIGKDGSEVKSSEEISIALGLLSGIIIYMLIFMFSSQVMRGVIEEKANRIVEVIVTSVKPFQLMMGKIIGVGLVGITQFVLWIVFTGVIIFGFQITHPAIQQNVSQIENFSSTSIVSSGQSVDLNEDMVLESNIITQALEGIRAINIPLLLFAFILFFLGGYLLYSAMFAAIAAAVDNEADTQQFVLPITIPLLITIILSGFIINNPQSQLAVWLSIIPFTSPVSMMMRIPFGVPVWQLILSILLLVATFIIATWIAGKIYHTGILLYGKKITWADLIKWISMKL
ncbi:MAG TPA: ABC transporter permease [Bacteroidales bacterium]|jgi:ABC-2 type transport system permease protein|nr:ABC transporter permease [Bacteroidales bacterium]MDI9573015.1 ABC transporter permease [Bacteroidota bacterium]OQC60051.1 MAG: ABC-2 family transporter protein [Bacteroidetes bacterium ADurb.Bin012]MBP9511747.1 ABC transporter permease [Bacteroidales bacterium]MBP9588518.1 ABC transporter permease [Bacteroidales bacterium]